MPPSPSPQTVLVMAAVVILVSCLSCVHGYIVSTPPTANRTIFVDPVYGNDTLLDWNNTAIDCGAALNTSCRSIGRAFQLIQRYKIGTNVWLNDGLYTGPENGNITLVLTNVTGPVKIRSINGANAVRFDQGWIRQGFTVQIGLQSIGSVIDGITFSRCRGDPYGAVSIVGTGVVPADIGVPTMSIRNCVFEHNVGIGRGAKATQVPTCAALLATDMKLATSIALPNHQAFRPLVAASSQPLANSTMATFRDGLDQPRAQVFSSDYYTTPISPLIDPSVNNTWQPAIQVEGCLFRNNSISGTIFSTAGGSAAVGIDQSYGFVTHCTFVNHDPYYQTFWALQFGGAGTSIMDQCTFVNNTVGPLVLNPNSRFNHYLYVSNTTFKRNGNPDPVKLNAPPASSGEVSASVVYGAGAGALTMANVVVSDSYGIGFNLLSSLVFRIYGMEVVHHTIAMKNFFYLASASVAITGLNFHDNAGVGGLLMGTLGRTNYMGIDNSRFTSNVGTRTGLFDASGAPAKLTMWVTNSVFIGNRATRGAVVYSSELTDPTAGIIFSSCYFLNNYATSSGGVASITSGSFFLLASLFSRNSALNGGAIYSDGGSLQVNGVLIRHQTAYNGAVAYLEKNALTTFTDSSFELNSASGLGGCVYDASNTWAKYMFLEFLGNTADNGGAIHFPKELDPLDASPITDPFTAAYASTNTVPSCSSAFNTVSFVNNSARVFGGAIMFDGAELPCRDFCGTLPDEANILDTNGDNWSIENCSFSGNVAESGSNGNNFASGLHHINLDAAGATNVSSDSSALTIFSGLETTIRVQLRDCLERPFTVSGAGESGVSLQLLVFADGRLLNPSGTKPSTQLSTLLNEVANEAENITTTTGGRLSTSQVAKNVWTRQAEDGEAEFTATVYVDSLSDPHTSLRMVVFADRTASAPLDLSITVDSCPPAMLLGSVTPVAASAAGLSLTQGVTACLPRVSLNASVPTSTLGLTSTFSLAEGNTDADAATMTYRLMSLPTHGIMYLNRGAASTSAITHGSVTATTSKSAATTAVDFDINNPAWTVLDSSSLNNLTLTASDYLSFQSQETCDFNVVGPYLVDSFDFISIDSLGREATSSTVKVSIYCTQIENVSYGIRAAFGSLAFLGVVACVCIGAFLIRNREEVVVKASSLIFNLVALVGCVGLFLSLLPLIWIPVSSSWCIARWCLPCMSVTLLFGSIFSKTRRIHQIFTNKIFNTAVMSNMDIFQFVMMLCSAAGVIIVISFSLDAPHPLYEYQNNDLHTVHVGCTVTDAFRWSMFGYLFAILIWGCWLAFRIRNVPSQFNECTSLGVTIYNTLLLGVLGIGVDFAMDGNQSAQTLVRCALLTLGALVIVGALYGTKLFALYQQWASARKRGIGSSTDTSRLRAELHKRFKAQEVRAGKSPAEAEKIASERLKATIQKNSFDSSKSGVETAQVRGSIMQQQVPTNAVSPRDIPMRSIGTMGVPSNPTQLRGFSSVTPSASPFSRVSQTGPGPIPSAATAAVSRVSAGSTNPHHGSIRRTGVSPVSAAPLPQTRNPRLRQTNGSSAGGAAAASTLPTTPQSDSVAYVATLPIPPMATISVMTDSELESLQDALMSERTARKAARMVAGVETSRTEGGASLDAASSPPVTPSVLASSDDAAQEPPTSNLLRFSLPDGRPQSSVSGGTVTTTATDSSDAVTASSTTTPATTSVDSVSNGAVASSVGASPRSPRSVRIHMNADAAALHMSSITITEQPTQTQT